MLKTIGLSLAVATMLSSFAFAQERRTTPVKVGVLSDLTGALSTTFVGGSELAARMAIEDFGGKINDLPIELLVADMQQKVDITMSISRQWLDTEGVDVIVDVPNSAAALAVNDLVREKDRIQFTIAGTTDITGKACNGHSIQWSYDNYSSAASLTKALVAEGRRNWFYLTADYAFGHNMEEISSSLLKKDGGTVTGAIRQPIGTTDQGSAIMQAAASAPDVIALANSGPDLQNSIKQLKEFGVTGADGPGVAAFVLQQDDIHAIGLERAAGLYVALPFVWNMSEEARKWSERFMEKSGGIPPNLRHATMYSQLLHYFKAMEQKPTTSGAEVFKTMTSIPSEDILFGKGELRPDGRHLNTVYLFQVKSPSESEGDWDYFKMVGEVSGQEAFRPMSEGGCPLVN